MIRKEVSRRWAIISIVSMAYLIVSFLLVGFKIDQLVLIAIFGLLFLTSSGTRKFVIAFTPFIIFWIVFDYMKAFPNYLFNEVHIKDLYDTELSLFGIPSDGAIVTPGEFFNTHHSPLGDILSGIFYLCWIPLPLLFNAYLYFVDREHGIHFALAFLLTNLIGFLIYYLFPAAPPWYVQLNGFEFHPGTSGNTAGLARFDDYFHIHIFHDLYAKSSNVFAAMPSLHSAYPLIVLYFSMKHKASILSLPVLVITVGIWIAAVYTNHHYVVDVLAGVVTAGCGVLLFEKIIISNRLFKNHVNRLVERVS